MHAKTLCKLFIVKSTIAGSLGSDFCAITLTSMKMIQINQSLSAPQVMIEIYLLRKFQRFACPFFIHRHAKLTATTKMTRLTEISGSSLRNGVINAQRYLKQHSVLKSLSALENQRGTFTPYLLLQQTRTTTRNFREQMRFYSRK